MEAITNFISLLNDVTVKTVLAFVGAWLWGRSGGVKKAVPVLLTVASGLVSMLSIMFPEAKPAADPASFAFMSIGGVDLYAPASAFSKSASWLWNTFAPVAFAIATHSGPKNTKEWLLTGAKLIVPKSER